MGDETNPFSFTGVKLPYAWNGIPAASQGFDWLNGNTGNMFPTLNTLSDGGATAPQWRNPLAYTSFGDANGFGDYLGSNAPLFMAGLNTLSGLTSAYTGLKGLSLAKDAFNQQKKEFNINLDNQVRSYNTQVSDRINGRHYNSEAERAAALAAAELVNRSKYGKGG